MARRRHGILNLRALYIEPFLLCNEQFPTDQDNHPLSNPLSSFMIRIDSRLLSVYLCFNWTVSW